MEKVILKGVKNLLIIIFILSIFNYYFDSKTPTFIEPEFQENFNMFIKECDSLDINTLSLRLVDSIKYKELDEGILGTYTGKNIYISPLCKNTITTLDLVLYHEYGHAMGLKHVDQPCTIMYKDISINPVIDKERKILIKHLKNIYFEKLKK